MHSFAASPVVANGGFPLESAEPILAAAGLGGQRGERMLFRGLDITLLPGQVVWLRGRNGRGKTSLLRLLAGLATPTEGELHVAGQSLRRAPAAWRRALLYIGHQNALKDDLTASEALSFLLRLGGTHSTAAQIDAALHRLGVHQCRHALVRTLSQGQRRRVSLARLALSMGQALWLLDEPFDALDADGVAALNELLAEHAQRGGATLLTSHQALSLAEPVPRIFDLDHHALA
jgi:heme exporter protein A